MTGVADLAVMAWGTRPAVEMCGTLLCSAGASVVFGDTAAQEPDGTFDILIVSSDQATAEQKRVIARHKSEGLVIVCDITAMGPQSHRGDHPWSDGEIQALSGLMDTTGFPDGHPVRLGIPFCEISAAFYAASAIAVATLVAQKHSIIQAVDVSLFACAVGSQTTLLPMAFVGSHAKRSGNRHAAAAPWNSYQTNDGWVLICTSTDAQWARLRSAIGDDRLFDPMFDQLASRVANVDELDRALTHWTSGHTMSECLALCDGVGIPASPIVAIEALHNERNFAARYASTADEITRTGVRKTTYRGVSVASDNLLDPDAGLADDAGGVGSPIAPLAGVRVVEIGQYTTAPLAAKHLAALGAEVIKVEPLEGEVTRGWKPQQNGMSYFFALNNSDKSIIRLNLRNPMDREALKELISSADVLIENLRPGTLAKLGMDRSRLAQVNSALIYCAISGFGSQSPYSDRPAFDTTIQAMGGFMDLTRSEDTPVKLGVSAADALSGQAALLAVCFSLAAGKAGRGRFLDVAMHDVATWCTLYAAGNPPTPGERLDCRDGAIWIDNASDLISPLGTKMPCCKALTRAQAIEVLQRLGITAVPIVRIDELTEDPDFLSDVLTVGRDENGTYWPLTKLPYRLHKTPGRVSSVSTTAQARPIQESATTA